MDVPVWLENFQKKLNPRLNSYLKTQEKQAKKIHPQAVILIAEITRFINLGGKRARPAFLYAGYKACGGPETEKIFDLSMVSELLHSWALIHDDIIDRSVLRRGQKTSHIALADSFKELGLNGDKDHYGLSAAILAGDLAFSLADSLFAQTPFPQIQKSRAQKYWDEVKFEVIHGEFLDVLFSYKREVTGFDVESVLEYKTAKYTIERPLQIGASLAGATDRQLSALGSYGLKLGQAFQIQDDIKGVFGDAKEIGKSVSSDLTEGKKTILILQTLENCPAADKQLLEAVLGNMKATGKQLETARDIIKKSGALKKSQDKVKNLVNRSILDLDKADFDPEGKEWLLSAAHYLGEN